jgi:hypothetical protein
MSYFLRDLGLTLGFVVLAYVGGRRTDGYLIGLYGGSTVIGDFLKWWLPKLDRLDANLAKFNNWLEWVSKLFHWS